MKEINEMMIEDASKYPDDKWDNYLEMLEDMKSHALLNGSAIVQADRPIQLRIAYRCENTGKTWSCRIVDIKKASIELKRGKQFDKADLYLRANATEEGKKRLLEIINGK